MKTVKENWELFKKTAVITELQEKVMLELELLFVTAFAMGLSEEYSESYIEDCVKRVKELTSELEK
jgi:hypothetical protein